MKCPTCGGSEPHGHSRVVQRVGLAHPQTWPVLICQECECEVSVREVQISRALEAEWDCQCGHTNVVLMSE